MGAKVKILIIGGSGMLGSMLIKRLHKSFAIAAAFSGNKAYGLEQYASVHKNIDARDFKKLEKLVKKTKPEFIINCAGIIKQIAGKKDNSDIMAINALLPHRLARLARENNARLIHFSTDCVFSGKGGPYSEKDIPDISPKDIYGSSKLLGEVNYPHTLTLRTSFIGPEIKGKHSFFAWATSQKGKKAEGYKNALYSGVTTLEMANIIEMIIKKSPKLTGLYQVAGEDISKYSLLKLINEIFGLKIEVVENNKIKCDRRLSSKLFRAKTGYKPKSWRKMLKDLKEFTE